MRRLFVLLLVTLGLSAPLRAQGSDIEATIGAQIEALRVDDFAEAFTYASPTIQDIFGNAENFGVMVQQGFPMVWRPAEVQYLGQHEADGFTYQQVLIRDAEDNIANGGDRAIGEQNIAPMPALAPESRNMRRSRAESLKALASALPTPAPTCATGPS